jgi:hypothetical protein
MFIFRRLATSQTASLDGPFPHPPTLLTALLDAVSSFKVVKGEDALEDL